jgi:hypothetical protein
MLSLEIEAHPPIRDAGNSTESLQSDWMRNFQDPQLQLEYDLKYPWFSFFLSTRKVITRQYM